MRDISCSLITLTILMCHVTQAKSMGDDENISTDSLGKAVKSDGTQPLQNFITTCLLISKKEELKFINSTTSVRTVLIFTYSGISSVSEESHLSFHRCHIYSSTGDSLINTNGGYISLYEVKLLNYISCSLVRCSSGKLIEVMDCSFTNILNVGGNFIMNGNIETTIVRDCLFENITVVGDEKGSVSERCNVEGSILKDVERGIYGGIVSGGHEFGMRNSTLIRNFRERNGATCAANLTSNCSRTSRLSLSISASYSFGNCTFANCSSSSSGAALYIQGTNTSYAQSLTILRCSFTNCSVTSYRESGGAICCYSSRFFCVSASNFTVCTATHSSSTGGAIDIDYISTDCTLSALLFDNCATSNQGGGLGAWRFNVSGDASACSDCTLRCLATAIAIRFCNITAAS